MSLGKQAKILSTKQQELVINYLSSTRNSKRDLVIFMLSIKAGLRCIEMSNLRWENILTPEQTIGTTLHLTNAMSKGDTGGRIIPLNTQLRDALITLWELTKHKDPTRHIIATERSRQTSSQVLVNKFRRWYNEINLIGCSSHSGRRTFITNTARRISTVGGSLRDIQTLAGHRSIQTTQRYIDVDTDAQRRVVNII